MSWPRVDRSLMASLAEAMRQGLWEARDAPLWVHRLKARPSLRF